MDNPSLLRVLCAWSSKMMWRIGETGRFSIRPCVFWGDKRQKVSHLAPISILASLFLGRVQLKKMLSKHGHYAPKRFTIGCGLTNTHLGTRTFQNVENQKSFLE